MTDASTPQLEQTYRPYRAFPLGRMLLGALVIVGGVYAALYWTHYGLRCDALPDGAARCTVSSPFTAHTRSFRAADVTELKLEPYRGSKGAKWARISVVERGRAPWVILDLPHDRAENALGRARAFLKKPGGQRLSIMTRDSWFPGLLGLVGGLLVFFGARDLGSIRVRLFEGEVRVDRRLAGVTLMSRRHPYSPGARVEIERKLFFNHFTLQRRSASELRARLVLIDGSEQIPLTQRYFNRGLDQQDAVARALQQRLAPEAQDNGDEYDSDIEIIEVEEIAPPVIRHQPLNLDTPFSFKRWLLFVGLLSVLGAGGAHLYAYFFQGWVTIQARHECRFQGGTYQAGADARMTLDPGVYAVKVHNPPRSGLWETQYFNIVAGGSYHIDCVPNQEQFEEVR